jgi:ATP-dependent DNA ligase
MGSEIKWDGYRLMIRIEDGHVTIRLTVQAVLCGA